MADTTLLISGLFLMIFTILTCVAWFITHYWLTKLVPANQQYDDALECIIDDETEEDEEDSEAVFTIEGFR